MNDKNDWAIYGLKPGMVVQCDFGMGTKGGGVHPEIGKTRPVVIVSRELVDRDYLTTVVPLSSRPPREVKGWHVEINTSPLPEKLQKNSWAKCDLVTPVSHKRLNLYTAGYDRQAGKRIYFRGRVNQADLKLIREGVLYSLDLGYLVEYVKKSW